jgi:malate synthase
MQDDVARDNWDRNRPLHEKIAALTKQRDALLTERANFRRLLFGWFANYKKDTGHEMDFTMSLFVRDKAGLYDETHTALTREAPPSPAP